MTARGAADTRKGLNATLSYSNGGRKSFPVRCTRITHGHTVLMEESTARDRRAAYPRKVNPQPFSISVSLISYSEFTTFMDWLRQYAEFMKNPLINDVGISRAMTVSVPSRRFFRRGLLNTGIAYGDHIGAMVWEPVLVFETSLDPLDRNPTARASSFRYGPAPTDHGNPNLESNYFYPFGAQLAGDEHGLDYADFTGPTDPGGGGTGAVADEEPLPEDDDAPPPVPARSGLEGDTNLVPRESAGGPRADVVPESLMVNFRASGLGGAFTERIFIKVPVERIPDEEGGGAIYASSEGSSQGTYKVFSSGNVALISTGQAVGSVA